MYYTSRMIITKKTKLIKSLKQLKINEVHNFIRVLQAINFAKEKDLNATLTRLLYLHVLLPHPDIMQTHNTKSKALRLFCAKEIGDI